MNPAPITLEDVEHVAKLARLGLSDAEKKKFTAQLREIFGYMGTLNEVDTTNVEPLLHVNDPNNVFREDLVTHSLSLDDIMRNAPSKAGSFLAVPNIRKKKP